MMRVVKKMKGEKGGEKRAAVSVPGDRKGQALSRVSEAREVGR